MIVIPSIDIKNGNVVRLVQGRFDEKKVYYKNPVYVARKFERCGAKLLHVIDLDGAKTGKMRNMKVIKSVAKAVKIPIQVGGGIRTYEIAKDLLTYGISKIILGTLVFDRPYLIKRLCEEFSADRVVIAIDVKDRKVVSNGWLKSRKYEINYYVSKLIKFGIKTVLLTSVNKDGMLSGPDFNLVKDVSGFNLSVIASGGITSIDDIRKLAKLQLEGIVIGKALYENVFSLKDAIKAVNGV